MGSNHAYAIEKIDMTLVREFINQYLLKHYIVIEEADIRELMMNKLIGNLKKVRDIQASIPPINNENFMIGVIKAFNTSTKSSKEHPEEASVLLNELGTNYAL